MTGGFEATLELISSFLFLPSDLIDIFHTLYFFNITLLSPLFFCLLTSVLMVSGLFPSLPRKCSGDNMVPSWWKSASLS